MPLPSSEQTSGPPESPSQASTLSSMEPAQNMPKAKQATINQSINQSVSQGVSASITLTVGHGIAVHVLLLARGRRQNGQLSGAQFLGWSCKAEVEADAEVSRLIPDKP